MDTSTITFDQPTHTSSGLPEKLDRSLSTLYLTIKAPNVISTASASIFMKMSNTHGLGTDASTPLHLPLKNRRPLCPSGGYNF